MVSGTETRREYGRRINWPAERSRSPGSPWRRATPRRRPSAGPSAVASPPVPAPTAGYDNAAIAQAWELLFAGLREAGPLDGRPRTFGLSWDDPAIVERSTCRYEAACAVPAGTPTGALGPPAVIVRELSGGLFARHRYTGPHDEVRRGYDRLIRGWLAHSPFTMASRPSREEYLTDPRATPPEEIETLLHIPLEAL